MVNNIQNVYADSFYSVEFRYMIYENNKISVIKVYLHRPFEEKDLFVLRSKKFVTNLEPPYLG